MRRPPDRTERHTVGSPEADVAAFTTLAPMRWSDMDALGHVHNARFLEYYESARTDLVQRLLTTLGGAGDVGLVVRRHEVDYLVPLVYRPRPLLIESMVSSIGTTSFALQHVAREDDGSVIYGRATTTIVAVDAGTGRALALPTELREALASYTDTTGHRDAPPAPETQMTLEEGK